VAQQQSRFLFLGSLGVSMVFVLTACSAPSPVQPTAAESARNGTLDRRVGDVGGGSTDGNFAVVTLVTSDGSSLTIGCIVDVPLSLPLTFFSCGSGEGTGRLSEAKVWWLYFDESGEIIVPQPFRLSPSVFEVGLLISFRGGLDVDFFEGPAFLSEGTLAVTINTLNTGSCQLHEIILDADVTGHLPHLGKVTGTVSMECQEDVTP
jgi:hypothetical protein